MTNAVNPVVTILASSHRKATFAPRGYCIPVPWKQMKAIHRRKWFTSRPDTRILTSCRTDASLFRIFSPHLPGDFHGKPLVAFGVDLRHVGPAVTEDHLGSFQTEPLAYCGPSAVA